MQVSGRIPSILLLAGLCGAAPFLPAAEPPAVNGLPASAWDLSDKPRNDLAGLPNFARVADGLYRGARPTAEGFATLEKLGVKTVVSLEFVHNDRAQLRGRDLKYVHIPCQPLYIDPSQVATFLKVATDPRSQPVFVHCQFGADRTGVMVAAYRRVVEGWNAERAVAEMEAFGHHNVFITLVPIVRTLDPVKARRRLETAVMPRVEIVR